jgi:hypothetical protein
MPQQPQKQQQAAPDEGQAPIHQLPKLPPEVEQQIPQGQARLSQATGQSLSQMEPRRVGLHLNALLAELAAALQFLLQRLEQQQGPPQPPQPA